MAWSDQHMLPPGQGRGPRGRTQTQRRVASMERAWQAMVLTQVLRLQWAFPGGPVSLVHPR